MTSRQNPGRRYGRFIVFEGPEGAGKTTQIRLAADALKGDGCAVRVTVEPGATMLGRQVRRLLLEKNDRVPTPTAELFLYLADRAQHVAEVIRPALEAGEVVLSDRFHASTIAYQGYGRGLDVEEITRADRWARRDITPDLTILLDCPVREGLSRARGDDRFHAEDRAFHERVRAGFLHLAAADPTHWIRIDSTQPKDAVRKSVLEEIRRCLKSG